MSLPKQITHPILIGIACAIILSILWIKFPSPENELQKPQTYKEVMQDSGYYQIVEMLPGGKAVLNGLPKAFQIDHDKFKNATTEQTKKLNEYFQGKFVQVTKDSNNTIGLPFKLYGPECFQQSANNPCQPILIQP